MRTVMFLMTLQALYHQPSSHWSVSSNQENRVMFSVTVNNTIVGKFGMLITGLGTISQSAILKLSVRDADIADLVERFGLYRITEKVRTEMKRFNKRQR